MPFGLTNAPATFQSYIDQALGSYIDEFAICYLDDILIYSTDVKVHRDHVTRVLGKLREHGLYAKASKCEFSVTKTGFLGFVISTTGVSMEEDRIASIEDWPTPTCIRDIQVLLGFTNFYRRFIKRYAKVTAPISDLLKKACKWEWTLQADKALRTLKHAFTEAPILQHFDPQKPIIVQTDASGFAIAGIINQYDGFGVLRPVAFYSRKCNPAEQNYDTHDRELLAIVESFKHWRHYLEGANHQILVRCDHKNLEAFTTTKQLSRRQARWAELLSAYDYTIEHLEGSKNPADGPSRRPDYEIGYERPFARLLATAVANPFKELIDEICDAQRADEMAQSIRAKLQLQTEEVGEAEGEEEDEK